MSSDQQYPHGYGDPDVAQTWEGQTWDTHYQPAVRPAQQQPHQPQAPQQPHPYATGRQPQAPQAPQSYATGQQAFPQPSVQQQPQHSQPSQPLYAQQPYAQPSPYAAETAYLPAQESGAYPQPPQAPQQPHPYAAGRQPQAPQAPQSYATGQQPHASQPYATGQQAFPQPSVQQQPQHSQPSQPSYAQQPYAQPSPYAAETAYLPAQESGAYPLPPEAPAAYNEPTSVLRPVDPQAAQAQEPGFNEPTSVLRPVASQAAGQEPGHNEPTSVLRPVAPQAAQEQEQEPGYGAPSTLGSVRLTDAQRARAEGRSPIIAPGIQPAGLTALLGVLLAVGAAVGTYGLLVPLVLLQAVTAAGWFRLNGMWPARQGIALAFAGGLAADVALIAVGAEHGPAAILGTLGIWVLLVLVLQLRSRAGSDERMYGLMATVVSSALAVVAAGHLAATSEAVVVGALAVAAAVLVRALPLPGAASLVASLLVAAGAGAAAGMVTGTGPLGALLGLGAGVCALTGLRAASYDYPSRFVHMTAGVALPLALAAPAVWLLGRVLA